MSKKNTQAPDKSVEALRKLRSHLHAAVRRVLQHHGLTKVGDAVVEADLIHAVLTAAQPSPDPAGVAPDAIARSKRILELVDRYVELPNSARRHDLRSALMDEFAAPVPASRGPETGAKT